MCKVNFTLATTNECPKEGRTKEAKSPPIFSNRRRRNLGLEESARALPAPFAAFLPKSPKLGQVVSVMDLSAVEGGTDRQTTWHLLLGVLDLRRWWESGSVGRIDAPSFLPPSLLILFPVEEQNIH